ncbi:MAG: radical SAM protein [Candidatus Methanoperedens sp.]|nr:radical SAM protein [Candidatus Methanoperedens sp.]
MIKEILVKTALSHSKLKGFEYALNPYHGCEHACVYCYAPSVIHWDKGKWGDLVEVKINLPRILSKELRIKKKGVVGLGTVTDPYQPAERKYEVTRRCLELLLSHDFPVCIQTKSSLVLRDIDLLKKFSNLEVGITLTSHDDSLREKLEPGAASVQERFQTLSELSKNGIKTWVFLGPVMPYLTDVEALIEEISIVKPWYVIVDKLRLRDGVNDRVMEFINSYYPYLTEKYEMIISGEEHFYIEIFKNVNKKCEEIELRCELNRI